MRHALLAALLAAPAAAQIPDDPTVRVAAQAKAYARETAGRAADAAQMLKAVSAAPSCRFASALEQRQFTLTITPASGASVKISFTYKTCREDERNDLQPAYTTRFYTGDNGYELVLVTDDTEGAGPYSGSAGSTSIVVAATKTGGFPSVGEIPNAALARATPIALGTISIEDDNVHPHKVYASGEATLTSAPAP